MRPAADALRPDWRTVTEEALADPAALMRALAAMGFRDYLGAVPRGWLTCWRPDYLTAPSTVPSRRAELAAVNRNLRDAEVHGLMAERGMVLVCAYSGEWRSADGAQRGDDLPSLGALMWGCRYGQAAGRIAHIIGLRRIPEARPVGEVWREIHAAIAARYAEASHA